MLSKYLFKIIRYYKIILLRFKNIYFFKLLEMFASSDDNREPIGSLLLMLHTVLLNMKFCFKLIFIIVFYWVVTEVSSHLEFLVFKGLNKLKYLCGLILRMILTVPFLFKLDVF